VRIENSELRRRLPVVLRQTFRLGTFAYSRNLSPLLRGVVFIGNPTLRHAMDGGDMRKPGSGAGPTAERMQI
jgi:hypothetical protein